MLKNVYSSQLFFDNLNTTETFTKEDFTEDLTAMEIIKTCMMQSAIIDEDKLASIYMDDIDRVYELIYDTDVYSLHTSSPVVKIISVEQSKENLLSLDSQPTVDDTDFF